MNEMTALGSLGGLPANPFRGSTVYRPLTGYEQEGDACTAADGRQGRIVKAPTGGLICQVGEMQMAADSVTEAAMGLRVSSSSRTQIGKAYADMVDHTRDVQGLGNCTVSTISGTPGAWYFTISSPEYNQFLKPEKIRQIYGVTVTPIQGTPQTASAPQPKSVSERVEEMVQELLSRK